MLSARNLEADVSKGATTHSCVSSNITNDRTTSAHTSHRRQSSVNAVSWNETVSVKCATPTKSPLKSEEAKVVMRKKLLHRRHQSAGNAKYITQEGRRRLSNLSWAQEEAVALNSKRPHSWGPAGTALFATDASMIYYANACYDLRLHGQCILFSILIFLIKVSKLLLYNIRIKLFLFFQKLNHFFVLIVNNTCRFFLSNFLEGCFSITNFENKSLRNMCTKTIFSQ